MKLKKKNLKRKNFDRLSSLSIFPRNLSLSYPETSRLVTPWINDERGAIVASRKEEDGLVGLEL